MVHDSSPNSLSPSCATEESRREGAGGDHWGQAKLATVIIPVFNEGATVNEVVSRVLRLPFRKEVVVVDDGSTDTTAVELKRWAVDPTVRVVAHGRNRGKGAAIRSGVNAALGRYTVIQDADLEYDPADLIHVLAPLISGDADVVYGSRYGDQAYRHPHFVSRHGVALLNLLVWLLYRVRLSDEATCYKAFRTDLLRRMDLQCHRFEFCPEVTAKACRMGIAIREVPVHYTARGYDAGKKLRLRDGVAAIHTLFRYRHWTEVTRESLPTGNPAHSLVGQ